MVSCFICLLHFTQPTDNAEREVVQWQLDTQTQSSEQETEETRPGRDLSACLAAPPDKSVRFPTLGLHLHTWGPLAVFLFVCRHRACGAEWQPEANLVDKDSPEHGDSNQRLVDFD
jgi:hypothetical protein